MAWSADASRKGARRFSSSRESGFTIVVIAALFLVFSLAVSTAVSKKNSQRENSRTMVTQDRIDAIVASLRQFQRSNGYYPSPALRTALVNTDPFGKASAAASAPGVVDVGTVRIGAVPVKALGLSQEYALDEWGNKLEYAVTIALTSAGTYGAGTGTIQASDGNGTNLTTPANTAQFLVYSHGRDQKGAYPASGTAPAVSCAGSAQKDAENCDDDAVFYEAPTAKYRGVADASFSDDVVRGSWSGAPAALCFTDQAGVLPSTVITSNSLVTTGYTGPLQAIGNAVTLVERNGNGIWARVIGGFKPGDTIRLRVTSSAISGDDIKSILYLGGSPVCSWSVVTM